MFRENYSKREQDVSKVFEARWKASHNNDLKQIKERESQFMKKMFDINNNHDSSKFKDNYKEVKSSKDIQLERLEQKMQIFKNKRNGL